MSAQPLSQGPTSIAGDESILIALATEGSPADTAVRRIGRFAKLKDLSLGFLLDQALASHEDLKRFGKVQQYEAEETTIRELERICRGAYCVLVSDSILGPGELASLTLAQLIHPVSDRIARFGINLQVRETIPPLLPQPDLAPPLPQPPAEAAPETPQAVAMPVREVPEPAPPIIVAAPPPPAVAVEAAPIPAPGPEAAPAKPAGRHEHISKHDLLLGDYSQAVADLDFDGLFVTNIRAHNQMDPRLLPFMHQKDISKLLMQANRFLQDGSYDRAIELYQLLAAGEPENTDYLVLHGKALLYARRFDQGLEVLKKAQSLGEQSAGSVVRRIESFRAMAGAYPSSAEGLRNLLGEARTPQNKEGA